MLLFRMNKKQRKTLETLFSTPIPKTVPWNEIESLLKAVGCTMEEREGSRVIFDKDGKVLHAHRPHPQKEVLSYVVKEVRAYLVRIGVQP